MLSDGVSVVAARAAAAALDDTEHVRASVSRNTDDRQEFVNQATARMLRPDSATNFVMLDTGRAAVEVVEHFRKHGILVSGPIRRIRSEHPRVPGDARGDARVLARLGPRHRPHDGDVAGGALAPSFTSRTRIDLS